MPSQQRPALWTSDTQAPGVELSLSSHFRRDLCSRRVARRMQTRARRRLLQPPDAARWFGLFRSSFVGGPAHRVSDTSHWNKQDVNASRGRNGQSARTAPSPVGAAATVADVCAVAMSGPSSGVEGHLPKRRSRPPDRTFPGTPDDGDETRCCQFFSGRKRRRAGHWLPHLVGVLLAAAVHHQLSLLLRLTLGHASCTATHCRRAMTASASSSVIYLWTLPQGNESGSSAPTAWVSPR